MALESEKLPQVMKSPQKTTVWATPECRNGSLLTVENKTWLTWRGVVDGRQLDVNLYLAAHIRARRTLEFLKHMYF